MRSTRRKCELPLAYMLISLRKYHLFTQPRISKEFGHRQQEDNHLLERKHPPKQLIAR